MAGKRHGVCESEALYRTCRAVSRVEFGACPEKSDRNSLLQFSPALNFSEIATIQSHHGPETVVRGETVVYGFALILPFGAVFRAIVEVLEKAAIGRRPGASQFQPDHVVKWKTLPYSCLPGRVYQWL